MDKDKLEQNIRILREWYEKQPHLPKGISEDYFKTFALGSKTLEIAKKKFDTFFSQRNEQVWMYDFEKYFQKFKEVEGGDYFMLPGKTPDGWRVLMQSYERVDVNAMDTQLELFRRVLSIELAIYLWPTDVSIFFVVDLKNVNARLLASVDIPSEISFIKYIQSAMPLKYKGTILLNSNPILEKTVNLMKPFMSKKASERVVFCSGKKEMTNILPRSMVPNEYGGEAGSIVDLGASWRKELLSHEDWFRKNSQLRSDESKRPRHSANGLDCGTFRSLAID